MSLLSGCGGGGGGPGVSSGGLTGAMNGSLSAESCLKRSHRGTHTHLRLIIQLLLISGGWGGGEVGADYIKVPLTAQWTSWQLPSREARTTESLWVGPDLRAHPSALENETVQKTPALLPIFVLLTMKMGSFFFYWCQSNNPDFDCVKLVFLAYLRFDLS